MSARWLSPAGIVAIALGVLVFSSVFSHAQTKPRVPIGIDPGGVAVAIVSETGIDYTAPALASRLARDGEGEVVGWDFNDSDRRPYASPTETSATSLALAILAEAPGARIAPFRAKPADKILLGKTAVYIARSPARIALFTLETSVREDWGAFAEVLVHFDDLLVVIPAGAVRQRFPAALDLPNLLRVSDRESIGASNAAPADLAAPAGTGGAIMAAARIAALAARLSAADPQLKGSELKSRILSFAKSLPPPLEKTTSYGWITDPLNPSGPAR